MGARHKGRSGLPFVALVDLEPGHLQALRPATQPLAGQRFDRRRRSGPAPAAALADRVIGADIISDSQPEKRYRCFT